MRLIGPAMALSTLLLAGCAMPGGRAAESDVARYAEAMQEAESAIDATLGRLAGFERRADHEAEAIAFSAGPASRRRGAGPASAAPRGGAAEATRQLFEVSFEALAAYTQNLAALGREPGAEPVPVDAAALGARAAAALAAYETASGRAIPEPVRGAGLAAIPAVAAAPAGNVGPRALAAERDGQIQAVVALLKAVVGEQTGQGLRGTIRARRDQVAADRTALLESIRNDPRASRMDRYRAYEMVAQARSEDPEQGALREVAAVLDRIAQADDGLARGDAGQVAANTAALQQAVERLWQVQPRLERPEEE
ncbi:hypothetical protein M0638_04010 [Roseomonas sp. NAR14]|uniref:Uncharacterized protein n=1 Tax=Roseomonas acroporae TaxID=2937791 RepID=A0A9X1Y7C0_9PROT|nr:hypothetical protein [Roseomonas acroporae]MCK8783545.1 hypothetical protein [Roseomonas acroporae]